MKQFNVYQARNILAWETKVVKKATIELLLKGKVPKGMMNSVA